MNHRRLIARAATLPLLGAALALPAAAAGADLHVTGGSGNCTSQSRGCTLETALGAVQTGDRVIVHAGAYGTSGPLTDSATASGVQIVGAPGEARPVLDTSSGALSLTHGTTLSNLDVTTTGGTALRVASGVVDRVRVSAMGTSAIGIALGSGGTIRNSAIIASGPWSVGVHVGATASRGTILGSTVIASGDGAAATEVSPAAGDATSSLRAVNTIFSGTTGALDVRVASVAGQNAAAVLHHCATTTANQTVSGTGSSLDEGDGLLTQAPLFVDAAGGDLREAPASPTIDAGTTDLGSDGESDAGNDASLGGAFDLDGDPRRQGPPDIGADERMLPASAVPAATTPSAAGSGPAFAPVGNGGAVGPASASPTTLPGLRPVLTSPTSYQLSARYPFRLRCDHRLACRGVAILTRVGGVRSDDFKIPAGETRTVYFQLTAAQRERVSIRGRKGLRGLLEIRSLQDGSSWSAVRLFPRHPRRG